MTIDVPLECKYRYLLVGYERVCLIDDTKFGIGDLARVLGKEKWILKNVVWSASKQAVLLAMDDDDDVMDGIGFMMLMQCLLIESR